MASCQYCYGEDDSLPKAAVIAMATRCYLACPLVQELVDGHCYIVPIQHHLSMLEGDDDVWDEVRVRKISRHPVLRNCALILGLIEFHEVPHENVRRRGQRRRLL